MEDFDFERARNAIANLGVGLIIAGGIEWIFGIPDTMIAGVLTNTNNMPQSSITIAIGITLIVISCWRKKK